MLVLWVVTVAAIVYWWPEAQQRLATNYGLDFVGYYLSAAATLSLVGLTQARETRHDVWIGAQM